MEIYKAYLTFTKIPVMFEDSIISVQIIIIPNTGFASAL